MFSSIFEQESIYGDKISENLFLLEFEGGVVWGMNVK
jgi:hypothetical protein